MQVEIWSDVVCPWCYLGKRRFEEALREQPFADDVQVVHRSYQLDPAAPRDHTVATRENLAAKYGLTPERVEQMQREMEARAAQDGLEYHLDGQHSGNTFDAHRLLQLAKDSGRQDALVEAMYRAYFTDGRSLFDAASLTAVATEAGLEAEEVADVLAGDRYARDVEADIAQAREYGITGVPFFVFDARFGVSGAQPVDTFRQVFAKAAG